MSLRSLSVVLLWAAASATTPVPPYLQAYTGPDQTGSSVTYYESQSSLGAMNDDISSICLSGCWLIYENEQYNEQGGNMLWTQGIRGCMNIDGDLDNTVSSLRRVGDAADASISTLTLYKGINFSGEEVFMESDSSSTTAAGGYQSAMVSGPDSWTIYSGENYSGESVCLESFGSYIWIGDEQIEYGLFWAPWYLGAVGGDIRSARKGCASGTPRLQGRRVANNHGNISFVKSVANMN